MPFYSKLFCFFKNFCRKHLLTLNFRPKECRISSGESELFPLHSFGTDGDLCRDERLDVQVSDLSQQIRFKYRTFRFQKIKTIDQKHLIQCTLKLTSSPSKMSPDTIPKCKCFSNESCDSRSWSYWSNCDGECKQTRIRNKNDPEEKVESRDCQSFCFFDVKDDIDEDLKTCSILNSRSQRDVLTRTPRLMNGSTVYPGSLPYVVRLTFQGFDQYHSDTQAGLSKHEL